MYLYVEALIDSQLVKITSFVMGVSNASNTTYSLFPTIVFLENDKLICHAVEENGSSTFLVFYNETQDFNSSEPVLKMKRVKPE